MNDKLANLHLMLHVKSFNRWPLHLHFLAPDVYEKWQKLCKQTFRPLRGSVNISYDTQEPTLLSETTGMLRDVPQESAVAPSGVAALDVGYASLKPYLTKTLAALEGDTILGCAVCKVPLNPKEDLILFCHHQSCEMVSHLTCLSNHFLDDLYSILPLEGNCPSCTKKLIWSDLLRELSLRIRGHLQTEQLLKKPRQKKQKATDTVDTTGKSDKPHEPVKVGARKAPTVLELTTMPTFIDELDKEEEEEDSGDDILLYLEDPLDDNVSTRDDMFDDSEVEYLPEPPKVENNEGKPGRNRIALPIVIANSDPDDVEEILV